MQIPMLANSFMTAMALALACAVLSVIVVLRRWAFIGEGIGHSGFGGAGAAWLLALWIPALANDWFPAVSVVVFCLATAMVIGFVSRSRQGVHADAAIGIFMVASLGFGFLAQQVYLHVTNGKNPPLFDALLFGRLLTFSPAYAMAATVVCLLVTLVVLALWKEILSYAFDPLLAETSGVRAGFIHYLLMILIGLVIVIGVRVAGSVLVTALLVLPGATALMLSRRLGVVVALSIATALLGAACGLLVNIRWSYLPAGPVMVLIMFLLFLSAYVANRLGASESAA